MKLFAIEDLVLDGCILMWDFHSCPLEEKWMSNHGGDEDYVIVCKTDSYPGAMIADKLTVCDFQEINKLGGSKQITIYITAHS